MLEAAFERGRAAALSRFGVKTARSAIGMPQGAPMHPAIANMHADLHAIGHPQAPPPPVAAPAAARPTVTNAEAFKNIAQQQAANVNPHPAELPPARAFEGHGSAAAGGGTGGVTPPSGGGGGGVGRFMRPAGKALRRGLGYAGLAAGGAALYGMHRQNEEDRDAHDLTYAPMQGSYMQ